MKLINSCRFVAIFALVGLLLMGSSSTSSAQLCNGQTLLQDGSPLSTTDWNGINGTCLCGGNYICVTPYNGDCWCADAGNCMYVHIRNLGVCAITKIELWCKQDNNSTKFNVCHPHKQFGWDCWTSEFGCHNSISNTNFSTNFCHSWSTQTLDGQGRLRIDFTPPAAAPTGCSDGTSTWDINVLNHFTFEVCGAKDLQIKVTYSDGTTDFYTPTVGTGCPMLGQ